MSIWPKLAKIRCKAVFLLLEASFLLQISRGLLCDEGDQLLHTLILGEEEQELAVLCFALLQDILLFHQLSQSHALSIQQLVDMGGVVQVKFPEHDGGGGSCSRKPRPE